MGKIFLVVLLGTVLFGCGQGAGSEQSAIEEAIRQQLKDPESATFSDLFVSRYLSVACVRWNAKNSLGGYGDWQYSELKKSGSTWSVRKWEEDPQRCTVSFYALLDKNFELVEEVLAMDSADPEIKARAKRSLTLEHTTPELLRGMVDHLETYVELQKLMDAQNERG